MEPRDELILEGIQSQVKVFRLSLLRGGAVELASRVDQPASGLGLNMVILTASSRLTLGFKGIKKTATGIALVTTSTRVAADAAVSLDESVGKELAVFGVGAEGLGGLTLLDITVLPEVGKDLLNNLGLLGRRGSAEGIKVDSEPVVNSLVKGVVLCAQGGRLKTFLKSLGLGSSSVLVGAADVDGRIASSTAESGKTLPMMLPR